MFQGWTVELVIDLLLEPAVWTWAWYVVSFVTTYYLSAGLKNKDTGWKWRSQNNKQFAHSQLLITEKVQLWDLGRRCFALGKAAMAKQGEKNQNKIKKEKQQMCNRIRHLSWPRKAPSSTTQSIVQTRRPRGKTCSETKRSYKNRSWI